MSYLEKIKAKTRPSGTDKTDKTPVSGSSVSFVSSSQAHSGEKNDQPLAAKLRALGQPIGLEVEGEVVAWIVADDEAAARADVGPCFTAAEAEVLAQFDNAGMRKLIALKARLGGRLQSEENMR